MRTIFLTVLSIFLLSMMSCGKNQDGIKTDEGTLVDNIYYSTEIGWKIKVPKGWTITNSEEMLEHSEIGKKILSETVGENIDMSKVKNLISFEKNDFNNFQSTSEPFINEYEGEWKEHTAYIKRIIFASYKNQQIKGDSTVTKVEKIDNIDFETYRFTVYNPDGGILLNQIIYSSLINGFDFSVNINYDNESDRDELLKALKSSKFTK